MVVNSKIAESENTNNLKTERIKKTVSGTYGFKMTTINEQNKLINDKLKNLSSYNFKFESLEFKLFLAFEANIAEFIIFNILNGVFSFFSFFKFTAKRNTILV
jgi:hypothetical protein